MDQIAGWRDFRDLNQGGKLRFIQRDCRSSLPNVLIRLLQSPYVLGRYKEEFSKLSLAVDERKLIIVALFCAHIGENAPTSFLSTHLETDAAGLVNGMDRKAGNETFRILRHRFGVIETVPSIGAGNILKNLIDDRDIVDTIAEMTMALARIHRDPFEYRIFDQMMRFRHLADTVTSQDEINRFYELCKTEPKIRERPLFWLQWHMAVSGTGKLIDAEKLLEQGFTAADVRDQQIDGSFDRRQLHDQRIQFLMLRARATQRSHAELLRDFKEACDLTQKILRQDDPKHYPFERLKDIWQNFEEVKYRMLDSHQQIVTKWMDDLMIYAKKRVSTLNEGFRKNRALSALDGMSRK